MDKHDRGVAAGPAALQRLRARERGLFPRLVQPWVLALLWSIVVVVVGAVVVITMMLGAPS